MINTSSSIRNSTASSERGKRCRLPRSAIAVAVALTLAGATAVAKLTPTLPDTSPLVIENASVQIPASFGPLVERVRSAVVNVAVSRTEKAAEFTNETMQGGKLGLRLAPLTTELRERFDVEMSMVLFL